MASASEPGDASSEGCSVGVRAEVAALDDGGKPAAAATSAGGATVRIESKGAAELTSLRRVSSSIYELLPPRRQWLTMLLMSCATVLLPFANTAFLPAIAAITQDLATTPTVTALAISAYMFAIGLSSLVWGPVADHWGRRRTLFAACLLFVGASLGCAFAPAAGALAALRALQGAAVAAFGVACNAVVADVFAPDERGKAMGVFAVPVLVGPVLGPLIGGALSQALGWRSTFVAVAVYGALVLVLLLTFMRETHHHYVLKHIRSTQGDAAAHSIRECSSIARPKLDAPWRPLIHLLDPNVLPHAVAVVVQYGAFFSCMVVLPSTLAAPPYRLPQACIGATNMALGLGLLAAAPLAGALADRAARAAPGAPSARMLFSAPFALAVSPAATLLFGWSLQARLHLAAPAAACFLIGAGVGAYAPAANALISIVKQQHAGAAGGALFAAMFLTGGVFTQVTPIGLHYLGVGRYSCIMAAGGGAAPAAESVADAKVVDLNV
ncbi:MAG: major facilitator superfamily domain-containing protein [Monoraphidium minutum]|nr:MAG: major facilitator superfamily domain-containing protein [Monoraphidium minutum]